MATQKKDLHFTLLDYRRRGRGFLLRMNGENLPVPFGSLDIYAPISRNNGKFSVDLGEAVREDGSKYEGHPDQMTELSRIANSRYIQTFLMIAFKSREIPKTTSLNLSNSAGGYRRRSAGGLGLIAENERNRGYWIQRSNRGDTGYEP